MKNDDTFVTGQEVNVDAIVNIAITKYSKLQRFLRRFERDPFLVEDLVQDVFVEVIKSASRYEGRSNPETWIFGLPLTWGEVIGQACQCADSAAERCKWMKKILSCSMLI